MKSIYCIHILCLDVKSFGQSTTKVKNVDASQPFSSAPKHDAVCSRAMVEDEYAPLVCYGRVSNCQEVTFLFIVFKITTQKQIKYTGNKVQRPDRQE